MNITKGEWKYHFDKNEDGTANGSVYSFPHTGQAYAICKQPRYIDDKTWEEHAQLICEAGNIANQTGLSPKQLLGKLDEAKDILRHLTEWDSDSGGLGERERIISKAKLFLK